MRRRFVFRPGLSRYRAISGNGPSQIAQLSARSQCRIYKLPASGEAIGFESYHLHGSNDSDQAVYNPSLTLAQNQATLQQRRPYAQYFDVLTTAKSIGTASFDGLTLSLQRQMKHGLTFIGGYRWSKCLDQGEYIWYDSATYTYPNDPKFDKGLCSYDIGSKLSFTYVYDLPTLSSLGFVGRHILGGWQTSGILTWQDGTPLGFPLA